MGLLSVVVALPVSAQQDGTGPVEIPLRIQGGRLVVPVQAPDGARLEFVLSTGSTVTVLSRSAAASLGQDAALTMGGFPVPMDGSTRVEDDELTYDGAALDGMISSNMLNQFDVLVDAPGGRLVLEPPGRSVDWEGVTMSEPIRLRIYHGIALGLDVELDGRPYAAALDLGTPTLVVNEPARSQLNIGAEATGTLALGATRFEDLPVRALDLEILGRWDPNGNGFVLVGAPITYDCALSISWVHRELRTCVR